MLELRKLIEQEVQTNPVIEEEMSEPNAEENSQAQDDFQKEFEQLAKLDEEWRDYMAQSASYTSNSREDDERRQFFFDSIATNETLQEHLLSQLHTSDFSDEEIRIGELIIGHIDDMGFFQGSAEEIAAGSGISPEKIEEVLDLVRTFHPVGVGAKDLRDCLLIQLKRLGKEQSVEFRIVSEHIADLGKHRFPEIAKRLGITPEQVQRSANFIATLDPKPGQIFSPDPHNFVLPDVLVERIGESYQISLNSEQIPHLRISNTYKDLMSQEGSGEVRDYVREKIRSGKFLIKSIHQRQQTISNIAHEIVARQGEFLEKGTSALKPMTMSQIAEAVGVHETTVSRAVSGKYMATPHGVFEMKYFFTPGYQTSDGATLSNTSVKEAIASLVASENGRAPLSDQEIVEILTERGIPIARRTVAKYRSELNILPSNMRKLY